MTATLACLLRLQVVSGPSRAASMAEDWSAADVGILLGTLRPELCVCRRRRGVSSSSLDAGLSFLRGAGQVLALLLGSSGSARGRVRGEALTGRGCSASCTSSSVWSRRLPGPEVPTWVVSGPWAPSQPVAPETLRYSLNLAAGPHILGPLTCSTTPPTAPATGRSNIAHSFQRSQRFMRRCDRSGPGLYL